MQFSQVIIQARAYKVLNEASRGNDTSGWAKMRRAWGGREEWKWGKRGGLQRQHTYHLI